MSKLDKDFKNAISQLSSVEKDKLIFRLLRKYPDVVDKLQFELVSKDSKEDRREEAKKQIKNYIEMTIARIKYSTPGILMMDMRDASGIVNKHMKTTDDKYGEIYLHIFIMKEYLKMYNNHFIDSSAQQTNNFNLYCISKILKIMVLLKKMHEDVQFDFAEDIKEIGNLFNCNPNLRELATKKGFYINWLTEYKIPENITEIEKKIKQTEQIKGSKFLYIR